MIDTLLTAATYLTEAERYEALGSLYRIVIPIFEKNRDLEVRGVTLHCNNSLT